MEGSVQRGPPVAAAWWRPAMGGLAGAVECLVVAALAVDVVITFTSTLLRYVLQRDLPWVPDASSILISVVAFLGGPAFFRRSRGMAYTALLDQMRGRARSTMEATGLWLVVAVSAVALFAYPDFLDVQARQMLPVLNISHAYTAIWLGIGLALLALYALEKLAGIERQQGRRAAGPRGGR